MGRHPVVHHTKGVVEIMPALCQWSMSLPSEALGPQGLHTLLLQVAQPLVQLYKGFRCVRQGTGLLCFMNHICQGQSQC